MNWNGDGIKGGQTWVPLLANNSSDATAWQELMSRLHTYVNSWRAEADCG